MRLHHDTALSTTLAALAAAAAALSIATAIQASAYPAPAKRPPPADQQDYGRCQSGFHEASAPNGNGYWCMPNGW